jgi:predicted DNA-binding protein YlxM (UPF0122 family)
MNKQERAGKLYQMRRLYHEDNWTLRQIGDHYGVSWQAIHERFVRNGILLRPKSRTPQVIDREILVKLYVDEKLSLQEVTRRLKMSYSKLQKDFSKYGIEKRSIGFFRRKYPQMYQLKVGEKITIPRPIVTNPYRNLYEKAKNIGIRISIKSINEEKIQITRLE